MSWSYAYTYRVVNIGQVYNLEIPNVSIMKTKLSQIVNLTTTNRIINIKLIQLHPLQSKDYSQKCTLFSSIRSPSASSQFYISILLLEQGYMLMTTFHYAFRDIQK